MTQLKRQDEATTDKDVIADLCIRNGQEWVLTHSWFKNDDFEYRMNEDKSAFVLFEHTTHAIRVTPPGQTSGEWFVDMPHTQYKVKQRQYVATPVLLILFCLTDKASQRQGHFSALLDQLKQQKMYIMLEAKAEYLKNWYKRSFSVIQIYSPNSSYLLLWG